MTKAICSKHHAAYDTATGCEDCRAGEAGVQRIVRELDGALVTCSEDDRLFMRAWVEKMHAQTPDAERLMARAMAGQWVTRQEVHDAGLDDRPVPDGYWPEVSLDGLSMKLVPRHG